MAQFSPGTPKIRAIGITSSNLIAKTTPLLFNEEKRREELLKTIDKINAKFGEDTIKPAVTEFIR